MKKIIGLFICMLVLSCGVNDPYYISIDDRIYLISEIKNSYAPGKYWIVTYYHDRFNDPVTELLLEINERTTNWVIYQSREFGTGTGTEILSGTDPGK